MATSSARMTHYAAAQNRRGMRGIDMLTYWRDEDGLTTVEYALLLALIVVVAITAWTALGSSVNSTVTDVDSHMP